MAGVGRRAAAIALGLAVTAAHLGVAWRLADSRLGWGRTDTTPRRIEVAFVRVLQPAPPPAVPPVVRRRPPAARARVADPAAPPASAPAPAAPAAALEPIPDLLPLGEVMGDATSADPRPADSRPLPVPEVVASDFDAVPPVAPAASGPVDTFDWPPSTRMSYTLTGHYRGPVEGSAQVEWLREGAHYQVRLDVVIGASLAPLITRRMVSDGELGPQGLRPRRYDERTRILWRDPDAATIHIGPDRIVLPRREVAPVPPGVQDAVSQFVHLTWRFTTDPGLLQPGRTIEVPLALPRHVSLWTYDVRESETLWTPLGPLQAVRVQPRRVARGGGDLVAESWYAPTLQYLPVRIVIRHDAETFIDLLIDEPPLQAAPEAADQSTKRRP